MGRLLKLPIDCADADCPDRAVNAPCGPRVNATGMPKVSL
jgi:hypothetical protein